MKHWKKQEKSSKRKVYYLNDFNKAECGEPLMQNRGEFSIKDGLLYVRPLGSDKYIPFEYKRCGTI